MDLLQLEYFREAAHLQHITQAANSLHITQPTLSKVIHKLEEELDCSLFIRDGKTVTLSPYGKMLLKYADKIHETVAEMHTELDDMKIGHTGSLTIGSCFPPREPPVVWDLTADFMLEHKNVGIGIVQLSPKTLHAALIHREVDLALSTIPISGDGIQWIELYSEPVGIILSRYHPASVKEVVELRDFQDMIFMCNDMNSDEANLTQNCCRMAGFEPRIAYAACVPSLIGQLVSRNQAVSMISRATHDNQEPRSHPWEDNVVFRPLADSFCIRHYGICLMRDSYHSKATIHYLQHILNHFNITGYDFGNT